MNARPTFIDGVRMQFDVPIEQFVIEYKGKIVCEPCLVFAFFAPELTCEEDLSGPFDAFIRRFGDMQEWFYNDGDQKRAKRLSRGNRAQLLYQMREQLRNPKNGACVILRPDSDRKEWRLPNFEHSLHSGAFTNMHLQIALPLSWLSNGTSGEVDVFLDEMLSADFPFTSGYVGLGFSWNVLASFDTHLTHPFFYEWLSQHPGLMSSTSLGQVPVSRFGLVDIGWITLLGKNFTAKAGGAEGIMQRIDAQYQQEISIRNLAHGGIAIQAGEWPQFGDVSKGRLLEERRAVGHALRCLWNEEKNGDQLVQGFPRDEDYKEHRKWANRFFV